MFYIWHCCWNCWLLILSTEVVWWSPWNVMQHPQLLQLLKWFSRLLLLLVMLILWCHQLLYHCPLNSVDWQTLKLRRKLAVDSSARFSVHAASRAEQLLLWRKSRLEIFIVILSFWFSCIKWQCTKNMQKNEWHNSNLHRQLSSQFCGNNISTALFFFKK